MARKGDLSEAEAQIQYGVNTRLLKMSNGRYRLHKASNLVWEYVDYLILTANFSHQELTLLAEETALERNVDFDRAFYNTIAYLFDSIVKKRG